MFISAVGPVVSSGPVDNTWGNVRADGITSYKLGAQPTVDNDQRRHPNSNAMNMVKDKYQY